MIDLINLSAQFNGRYLFKDFNYKINSGDRISLVGANGTGKSTLLRIIAGKIEPESGTVIRQKDTSMGYLPQENVTHTGRSLIEEAKSALTDIFRLQKKELYLMDALESQISPEERDDLIHQLGEVHCRLEGLDSYSAENRVEKILTGLCFEEGDFHRLTDEFSGGWQMKIALAKILISQNDILLLDEPTNHLDLDSLEWLIGFLKGYKGALLIVSHDKHFLDSVTDKTLEIYLNRFYAFKGNYDAYLQYKEARDMQEEQLFIQQQKRIKETERFIERFRYKSTKARQVQSRVKQLERIKLIDLPKNTSDVYIRFPDPPRSGQMNIELRDISKSYGDKNIFRHINFGIQRGEKIAFVGPNGSGKTTLSKIIAGIINVDSGERVVGHNTIISYYAQDVADTLNPDLDLLETMEMVAEDIPIGTLRSLLGCFLFTGDDVFKKVGVLSGGEKSRVAIAKILLTQANLIVLDEPTNHLDYSSKQVLQKALRDFSGSLVLVSHDVDFLSPIVNKVLEIRMGTPTVFPGGIDYYLAKRKEYSTPPEPSIKEKGLTECATNRKEQKRVEAELRQQRYAATKGIKERIAAIEKSIESLEKRQMELECILSSPTIYSDPQGLKEKNREYRDIRTELEKNMGEWERLSSTLTDIESQFSIM